jgi:hypothetical protein
MQKLRKRTARVRQRAEESLTSQQRRLTRRLASIVEDNKQAMVEHVAALEIMLSDHTVSSFIFVCARACHTIIRINCP